MTSKNLCPGGVCNFLKLPFFSKSGGGKKRRRCKKIFATAKLVRQLQINHAKKGQKQFHLD